MNVDSEDGNKNPEQLVTILVLNQVIEDEP